MRLSKLTLSGFKSFADRTQFTFDQSVTGIVGPNGCGKSNIVDAIKWVLGERSSKSLRGKEMIDVIFAGSAGRKPLGLASVTLTFDNPIIAQDASDSHHDKTSGHALENGVTWATTKRRTLPIDAEEVDVERKLFRDGTSHYLINNKRVRLRDIRELFLDTGVGADAYSIIEQGKVDAMLLSNPQERRTIFEEAAGIARYKQRRVEAQRKLERTEVNLTRTREQLASTDRRLRIVKGQASRARRFLELDQERSALRMTLSFDEYDDLRQRLDGLTSRIADLEQTRQKASEALAQLESAHQDAEIHLQKLQHQHKELEHAKLQALHDEQSSLQKKQMTQRAIQDARERTRIDQQRLEETLSRIQKIQSDLQDAADQVAALSEQVADAERDLRQTSEARAAILEQLNDQRSKLAEYRSAAARIDRERATLLASQQADQRRVDSIDEQISALHAKAQSFQSEFQDHSASLKASEDQITSLQTQLTSLDQQLVEHDAREQSLSADQRQLSSRVSELDETAIRLDARRSTLQELVDSRQSLGKAVRHVLDCKASNQGFESIIAPLADLIETDSAHAAAIEAALGATLTSLVVQSLSDLPDAEALKQLPGRVGFLPIHAPCTQILPAELPAQVLTSSRVTPLRQVIWANQRNTQDIPDLDQLLDRLLAGLYLVQDLDAALLLAAALPENASSIRFVTQDGTVLSSSGVVWTGPMSGEDASGVLGQKSELAELHKELSAIQDQLETERSRLQAADSEVARLAQEKAGFQSQHTERQRLLLAEQTRCDQINMAIARLEREREGISEETAQLRVRKVTLERECAELVQRAEKLAGLHDEQQAKAEIIETQITKADHRIEAATEQMTTARVRVGQLGEQLSSARRERRRLEAAFEESSRQKENLTNHMLQAQTQRAEHEQSLASIDLAITEARETGQQLEAQTQQLVTNLASAKERADEFSRRVGQARQQAKIIERDWHSVEVARRELEIKREALEERTAEELAIDLAGDYFEYCAVMASGDVLRIEHAPAKACIQELRTQIKSLGNVNLDAIDEEQTLAQRNEDLIKQVADIDDARVKLIELIDQLNLASRERFGEVFERISEHFAGRDGMFRKLFGGGRAEIRLMPLIKEVQTDQGIQKVQTDEIDLLESGIEIIAKPPGKEPRSINQLSGGEKTLTAVALLLAIFKSKPSCFCILDEVDAALDDANVDRYCSVVRDFASSSHFIVITHNKRTMQAADRLYGITMQEKGVSKRVSVRFDQVKTDGSIKPSALKADETAPPPPPPPEAVQSEASENQGSLRQSLANMRQESQITSPTKM